MQESQTSWQKSHLCLLYATAMTIASSFHELRVLEYIWHENCEKKKVSVGEGSGVQSGKIKFPFFVLSYKLDSLKHFCICGRKVMASSKGKSFSPYWGEFSNHHFFRENKMSFIQMLSGLSVQLAVNAPTVAPASGTATIWSNQSVVDLQTFYGGSIKTPRQSPSLWLEFAMVLLTSWILWG